jgi:hypothetical protein
MDDHPRPRGREYLMSLLILALSWWFTLPDHQRTQYRMRLSRLTQQGTHRLAKACARYAMSEELAGDAEAAAAGYASAYRLMTGLYERAGHWYQRM